MRYEQMEHEMFSERYRERLVDAINAIRPQILSGAAVALLDKYLLCLQPGYADRQDREALLPWRCAAPNHRPRNDNRFDIMLAELAEAIVMWWDYLRTADVSGIGTAITRLEGYGEHGFLQCDILGDGESGGYYLFNPAAQAAASGGGK